MNWGLLSEPLRGSTAEAAQRICRLAQSCLGARTVAMYRLDDAGRWHRLCTNPNHPAPSEAEQLVLHALVPDETSTDTSSDKALSSGEVRVIEDAGAHRELADHPWVSDAPGLRFFAAAPLRAASEAKAAGHLLIGRVEPAQMSESERQVLVDLAGLADELLESEEARRLAATAQEELERANAHSQHLVDELSRSNQQLEQFAYVASHDLQEPLRMITGFLGLLVDEYADQLDEDANEYINYAVDGAKRMRHLINDLLSYSRVFSSDEDFVTVDTEAVFIEARDEMLSNHPEVEAVVDHETLPEVRGRRRQLLRLFSNLFSNAVQYSKDNPHIEVWSKERDEDFLFAISDEGVGVELDQQERIFQIFVRGSNQPAEKGTGIGLAICTSIVEAHGGRLWVESPAGEGATFYFTLAKQPQVAP